MGVYRSFNNLISSKSGVFFLDLCPVCGTIDNGGLEVTY
jgi:hypothetical protein